MEWVLTLWLSTGAVVREPTTPLECALHMGLARYVTANNAGLSRPEGMVVRLDCGGRTVVLALPPSTGACEMEPAA